jgi:hypothetical protein
MRGLRDGAALTGVLPSTQLYWASCSQRSDQKETNSIEMLVRARVRQILDLTDFKAFFAAMGARFRYADSFNMQQCLNTATLSG